MQNTYYKSIDYVKIICAILVVCIHTGPLLSVNEEANFFLVQVLARMAVPFFLVSSAFFFFRKLDYTTGLRAEKNLVILKKYSIRLCKMYLLWSLVYLTIQIPMWIIKGFTVNTVLLYLRDFFYQGSYYHLWFLPALIFSTFLVYYLLRKMRLKKVLGITFVLYIIGMLINVYGSLLEPIPGISIVLKLYLNIFMTARNGLFFGCIYVLMGFIMARCESTFKVKRNVAIKIFIVSFIALIAEVYFIRMIGCMNDLTSMYIMLVPCTFSLFCILMTIKSNIKNTSFIRNVGTTLYFSHCYFAFILGNVSVFTANSLLYFSSVLLTTLIFIVVFLKMAKKFSIVRSMI